MNNEIAGRYETKGRWAYEAGLGFNNRQYVYKSKVLNSLPNNLYMTETSKTIISFLELNLSVDFKITMPKCIEQCPALGRVTNYVGISASPTMINRINESKTINSNEY